MESPKLVPELGCSNIERSLKFYTEILGFEVLYARPEEGFAYVSRDGAELMLDQVGDRPWTTAELTHPYGRGMNLQIEVADVQSLYATVQASGAPIYLALEDKWYRRDQVLVGNRQFIVLDPDGYFLRFAEHLGERPA